MDYLGGVMQFTLDVLLKLSAQAKENELKIAYKKFLEELNGITQSREANNGLFAFLVIKGLRFVLQQIQVSVTVVLSILFSLLSSCDL